MITFLITASIAILGIWLLFKAICFIFKLTWGTAKILGISLAVIAAVALIFALLI